MNFLNHKIYENFKVENFKVHASHGGPFRTNYSVYNGLHRDNCSVVRAGRPERAKERN